MLARRTCFAAKQAFESEYAIRGKAFCPALSICRTSRAVRRRLFARTDGISQFCSQQGAGLFAAGRVLWYSPKAKNSATLLRAKELFRSNAQTIKARAQKASVSIKLQLTARLRIFLKGCYPLKKFLHLSSLKQGVPGFGAFALLFQGAGQHQPSGFAFRS